MSGTTNIQWTERTWNAGIFGCSKVSEGCRNCYAMKMAARIAGAADARERAGTKPTARQAAYQRVVLRRDGKPVGEWNNVVVIDPDDPAIMDPLRVRKPTMWFTDSMHDWFHPNVPFEHLDRLFAVMAMCPHHTFQVLTKRPERMGEYLTRREPLPSSFSRRTGCEWKTPCDRVYREVHHSKYAKRVVERGMVWPLPNVWLGTSCEDQETWDKRVPELLRCPAAVRFVSCEPLLGVIDATRTKCGPLLPSNSDHRVDVLRGGTWTDTRWGFVNHSDFPATIDWIIAGGESGPNARPMDLDWARSIRDQCKAAGVAFFMKQMGGRSGHKGAMADLPEDLRVREFPVTRHTQQGATQ